MLLYGSTLLRKPECEVKNRIVNLLLVIFVFVLLSLWVGYSSKKAAIRARKFEPTAARLERGRYIVEGIAHCFECHSEVDWETPGGQPREGRKGSGTEFAKYGFPWLVAPNITPDTETGAGTWTDEQLARAIREGIESQFAGAATDLRAGSLT